MKFVVFSTEGSRPRVGLLLDERVIDLHVANSTIPSDLLPLIQGGQRILDLVRAVNAGIGGVRDDAVETLRDVRIHAPWPGKRVAMLGGNFGKHLYDVQRGVPGIESLEQVVRDTRRGGPWGFFKSLDTMTGPGEDLVFSKHIKLLDYEAEVGIVMSRQGKNIKSHDVSNHIWGFTLLNDWSDRDINFVPRPYSWNLGKNFDGAATIGPCIVVDEITDAQNVDVETKVDGQLRQAFNTRDMIFSFGEAVEYISRGLTLVPGDLISGGTGAGTAIDIAGLLHMSEPASAEWFLEPGDVVEISSPQIGSFHNRIVADSGQ